MENKETKLKDKRIFVGFDYAGSEGIHSFTRVLKSEGFKIDFYGFGESWNLISVDKKVKLYKNPLVRKLQGLFLLLTLVFKYDIFHFYFGQTFSNYKIDNWIFKILGKKVIRDFRGSEVYNVPKSIEKEGKGSPYYEIYQKKGKEFFLNEVKRNEYLIRYANSVVLAGPWLVDSVSKYDFIIPYSRDIEGIRSFKKPVVPNKEFTVLHPPTNPAIKGSKYIIEAIERLRKEGLAIKLVIAEKVPKNELLELINQSDLVIDQILLGWYGGLAVEVMALEKPVIAFINEDYKKLVNFGDEIPVINANKNSLEETLKKLPAEKESLESLGKRGYAFVKKHHDAKIIAGEYKKIYESII